MQITTAVILDTRRALSTKEFPVKLRLTFMNISNEGKKWTQKYFPTPYSMTEARWARVKVDTPRSEEDREMKRKIWKLKAKAEAIVEAHEVLTPAAFEVMYNDEGNYRTVDDFIASYIEKLEASGQIGTSQTYKCALSSFKRYNKEQPLVFGQVNVEWLEGYENSMIEEGRSPSTLGFYLRNLRAIYNQAIERKVIKRDLYPFGRNRYQIPTSTALKRALSTTEKDSLLTYTPKTEDAALALAMWKFSYFCYGMNMKDIILLKCGNIQQNTLVRTSRAKTSRTDRKKKVVQIPMRAEVVEIIARHGNRTLNPNDYVFPFLIDGLNAKQIDFRVHDVLKYVNEELKLIGEDLKLSVKLTTYTARHTFATVLRNSGVDTRFIQEALGHSSETTTENYFGSFENASHLAYVNKL
jgi:integrase/recombinase XerD